METDDHQRRSASGATETRFRIVAVPTPQEGVCAALRAAFGSPACAVPADWERLLLEIR